MPSASDSVDVKRWAMLAATASGLASLWWFMRYWRQRMRWPPKGPGVWERLQTLQRFSHKQVEWAQKYGPIYRTWDPVFGIAIHVADPDIMYDITVRAGNLYRDPCRYGRPPKLAALVAETMGPSVTGMVGAEWRWRKDSLIRQFHNTRLLSPETGLLEALLHEGDLLCAALGEAADESRVVAVDTLTTRAATGVMLFLMYGRRPAFDEEAFKEGSKNLMTVLLGIINPFKTKKQMEDLRSLQAQSQQVFDDVARPELNAILEDIKAGKRGSHRKPCMMEALMKNEPRYTRNGLEGLLADARVFVNAGYETTAHSLAFTFGLLADPQNSAVAELARKEAVQVAAAGLQRETLIESTAYLDRVFHESIRLFPLAPALGGLAYADFEVSVGSDTLLIPKGANILFHNVAGQRCDRLWPDPHCCNPEHWNNGAAQDKRLMTFNLGAHACPGKNLSHLEARVFLSMVLSKFRFELPDGVDKVEAFEEVLFRPKDKMPLRVFRL